MKKKNRTPEGTPAAKKSWKSEPMMLAGGVLLEVVVLAPAKTVHIGNREIQVGGLFPMAKNQIASVSRAVLNRAVPKTASTFAGLLRRTKLNSFVRDKILDLLYDTLEKYSISTLVSKLFDKSGLLEKNDFTKALRTYFTGVLENKDERDKLAASLSDGVLNGLRKLTEGTVFSLALTDKVVDGIRKGVSSALEKLFNSELWNYISIRLLDASGQMDKMTLSHALTEYFGYDREKMGQYLDSLYEKYLGNEMVRVLTEADVGDKVYRKLMDLDYDAFFKDLVSKHVEDLVRFAVGSASAGIFLLDRENPVGTRASNAREFRKNARNLRSRGSGKIIRKAIFSLLNEENEKASGAAEQDAPARKKGRGRRRRR